MSTKSGETHNFDFESSKKTYTVTVGVTDSNPDDTVDDTITVTINLTNVDELGMATITGTPKVGQTITGSVTDPDGSVNVIQWQWKSADSQSGPFNLPSGTQSNFNNFTPNASHVGKYIQLTAVYSDALGAKSVLSNVIGPVVRGNADPTFSDDTATRTLPENSGAGVAVGAPIIATDADSGDTLYYLLTGTDAGSFDIDANGQLSASGSTAFDFEGAKTSYTVIVNVSDRKNASGGADTVIDDTLLVTISVNNVDEDGAVSLSPPAEPKVATVITVLLSDPDGGMHLSDLHSVHFLWERSSDQATWSTINYFGKAIKSTNVSNLPANSNYTPTVDDLGKYLRVTVTYTDAHGPDKTAQARTAHPVGAPAPAPNLTVQTLLSGLTLPRDIAFTPDGTMLFTSRRGGLSVRLTNGTVRAIESDLSDLADAELGVMMSIAVDPDFATNRRFYTFQGDLRRNVGVVAWTIDDAYQVATRVADPLVDGFFGGARIRFGPDGYLWMGVHNGSNHAAPQNLSLLGGKVLRFDASTGAGASGNPFAESPLVYTYGHRNPQGLALRPGTTEMWSVEHGPAWDDEINLLTAGANYGWNPDPSSDSPESALMTDTTVFPDALEAKWTSGFSTIAPSGATFLEGEDWGAWEGRLAVATLKTLSLRIFEFGEDGSFASQVIVPELLETYGRLRTPVLGPDGSLYITTSNATKVSGTDWILRVVPSLPPAFSSANESHTVSENAPLNTLITTLTASDPEAGSLRYEISGNDTEYFYIGDEAVGDLRLKQSLDFETKGSYELVVKASDPYDLSDELTLSVNVIDVDERPEIAGPDTVQDFPENSGTSRQVGRYTVTDPEGATVTMSLSSGGADFTFAGNGVLTFQESPDFEERGTYSATVRAVAGSHTVNKTVTVNIQNVEEAGAVTLSAVQPQEGIILTATLDDDDGPTGITWQWYRTSSRGSNGNPITNADSESYTPGAADVGSYLRAVASYDDGYGDDKNAAAVSSNRVQEAPPAPAPPVFPADGDYDRTIRENLRAGRNVGAPVTATDGNNDRLTYSIAASDEFEIVESTGQLRTKAELDYEGREQHFVTVTATDPGGLTDTVSVTITVTDVNEGPEISRVGSAPGSVRENYDPSLVLARYTATDPEEPSAQITRWSTSGTDGGDFVISEQGELRFRYTPDYERPADSNRDNTYVFTVQVSDGRYYGTFEETITVTPVNEPPTITTTSSSATALRQNENVISRLYTYRATDPERSAVMWSVGGMDGRFFAIDERGQFSFKQDSPPDFEQPGDSSRDNVYDLTIQARDDGFNTASLPVTVTVREVNEGPEVLGQSAFTVAESQDLPTRSIRASTPREAP